MGTCCALVIALLPGLNVSVRPAAARKPDPGKVRDHVVRLDAGRRVGHVQARRGPDGPAGEGLAVPAGRSGTWESEVLEVGRARMVGVSWKRQEGSPWSEPGTAEIWYRTARDGTWTDWERVEPSEATPEPGSIDDTKRDRVFSDPIWLEADVTHVQLRVEFPGLEDGVVDDLVTHLIEPDMTPTPTDAPAGAAVAAPAKPAIITRAKWGADEKLRGPISYGKPVQMGFLHHTVQSNSYTKAESAALVRADYLYHVRTRGWADVGYNFLVDRFGQIFEGRAGGVDRSVIGAHTGGFNNGSFGVALIGEFTNTSVPTAAVNALKSLFAWKLDVHHVDPNSTTVMTAAGADNSRYKSGQKVTLRTISGHRDVSYTACPGNRAYSLLPSLRSGAAALGRPKIFGGQPSSSVVKPHAGVTTTLSPRFSQSVRWTAKAVDAAGVVARTWGGIATSATITWDGRRSNGLPAAKGTATITVTAEITGASARPLEVKVTVDATPPPLAPPDGQLLTNGERVAGGGARWPYAGAAERDADQGPSAPVALTAGQAALLTEPRAGFPDGILVRAPGTGMYLISDGRKRWITDRTSLDAHGLGTAPVTQADRVDLDRMPEGAPVAATDPMPDGVVIASGSQAWRIEDGRARPIASAAVDAWKARTPPATAGTGVADPASYPAGAPLGFPDGSLMRTKEDGKVWIISDGVRRHVTNANALAAHGLSRSWIKEQVPLADVALHPVGASLSQNEAPASGTIVHAGGITRLVLGTRGVPIPGKVIATYRMNVQKVSGTMMNRLGKPVRSYPDGTVLDAGDQYWVVSGGKRRALPKAAVNGVVDAARTRPFSHAAYTILPPGPALDPATPVADDTLWRWEADGRLYRVENGRKRRIATDAEASWTQLTVNDAPAGWTPFASLPDGPELGWRDGALVRSTTNGRVWVITGGVRRWVVNGDALARAGLVRDSIVPGSETSLALHRRVADLQ